MNIYKLELISECQIKYIQIRSLFPSSPPENSFYSKIKIYLIKIKVQITPKTLIFRLDGKNFIRLFFHLIDKAISNSTISLILYSL